MFNKIETKMFSFSLHTTPRALRRPDRCVDTLVEPTRLEMYANLNGQGSNPIDGGETG
ncbi:MAG: hypothetical protein QGH62_05975 [Nitrospinaceae bacterium]|nr:hypothetical protein [Nitrospinaceae bacterium]